MTCVTSNVALSIITNLYTLKIRSHRFLCALAKLRKATQSFVMSVCLYGKTRLQLDGWIFMKFDI